MAYESGSGTLEELAEDFHVSLGWAKKVSAAYTRTGRMERRVHRPGRKPKVGDGERALLRKWLEEQPDLTLAELQVRLHQQAGVKVHPACICRWLRRMGQRLKKSRSTPKSETPKRTSNGAANSPKRSVASPRNG